MTSSPFRCANGNNLGIFSRNSIAEDDLCDDSCDQDGRQIEHRFCCLPVASNFVYPSLPEIKLVSRFQMKVEKRGASGGGKLRVDNALEIGKCRVADTAEVSLPNVAVNPTEALLDSIDTALTDLVGARAREAIFNHLDGDLSITREDLPTHLDEFRSDLRANFGTVASTIESFIAERFCVAVRPHLSDITIPQTGRDFEFVKEIIELRKQ